MCTKSTPNSKWKRAKNTNKQTAIVQYIVIVLAYQILNTIYVWIHCILFNWDRIVISFAKISSQYHRYRPIVDFVHWSQMLSCPTIPTNNNFCIFFFFHFVFKWKTYIRIFCIDMKTTRKRLLLLLKHCLISINEMIQLKISMKSRIANSEYWKLTMANAPRREQKKYIIIECRLLVNWMKFVRSNMWYFSLFFFSSLLFIWWTVCNLNRGSFGRYGDWIEHISTYSIFVEKKKIRMERKIIIWYRHPVHLCGQLN